MHRSKSSSTLATHRVQRRKRILFGFCNAMTACIVAACSSSATGGNEATTGGSVDVGFLSLTTGKYTAGGTEFKNGVESALRLINDKHVLGTDLKLNLIEREAGGDPARNVSAAKQMVANPHIVGIVCCALTPVTGALKPVAKSSKTPMIIYGATAEGLAELPYVLRTMPMPQMADQALVRTAVEQTGVKTVALHATSDNPGSVSQLQAMKEAFKTAGVKELATVNSLGNDTSYTSVATQLMALHPDMIATAGIQPNAVGLVVALHNLGYQGRVISIETIVGVGIYKSNPAALADIPFPAYFLASAASGLGKSFVNDYTSHYGEAPGETAAQGFNGLWVLAGAIKAAGPSPTRASVTKALNRLDTLSDTVYGSVKFDRGQIVASPDSIVIASYTAPNGEIKAYTFKK